MKINLLLIVLFTIFLLSSCSSNLEYPFITQSPTSEYRYAQVVWRDLVTPDPKKAGDFYKKVRFIK